MKYQYGFNLIEILVSVLILSTGLLGLVGLQAKGLRDNISAYHTQQATQFAYNIIDRMRINRVNANLQMNSIYISKKPVDAKEKPNCFNKNFGCTTEEMAENDVYEWYQGLNNVFPNGQGSINFGKTFSNPDLMAKLKPVCNLTEPTGYWLVIAWDDNRDQDIGSGDRCFRVDFEL